MVFGTSSQGMTYKDLAKKFSAYMCGHLHRLVAGKYKDIIIQRAKLINDSLPRSRG